MTVVPVGAALIKIKLILKGITRFDASEAKARHTIHTCWQDNAVPVYRAILSEVIRHANSYSITFTPTQYRGWHRTIDGRCHAGFACKINWLISNI